MRKFALSIVIVALGALLQAQLSGLWMVSALVLFGACEYLTNAVAHDIAAAEAMKRDFEIHEHLRRELYAARAERDEAQEQAAGEGIRAERLKNALQNIQRRQEALSGMVTRERFR